MASVPPPSGLCQGPGNYTRGFVSHEAAYTAAVDYSRGWGRGGRGLGSATARARGTSSIPVGDLQDCPHSAFNDGVIVLCHTYGKFLQEKSNVHTFSAHSLLYALRSVQQLIQPPIQSIVAEVVEDTVTGTDKNSKYCGYIILKSSVTNPNNTVLSTMLSGWVQFFNSNVHTE